MKLVCEHLYNHTASLVEELAKEIRGQAKVGRIASIQTFIDARLNLIQDYLKAIDKLER